MARKKSDAPQESGNGSSIDLFLKKIADIDPISKYSEEVSGAPVEFIDTGAPALNAIISGDLYGGIPRGKVVGFSGESGTGKTFICCNIIANAQKKGYYVLYFDSEFAFDAQSFKRIGVNLQQISVFNVSIIEKVRNQLISFMRGMAESKNEKRVLVVIDSIGNLRAEKELEDSVANKTSGDMGHRAKVMKSFFSLLTSWAGYSNIPVVFTNHVMENPSEMFKTIKKQTGGGKGPEYLSTILVQLSKSLERDVDADEDDSEVFIPLTASSITGVKLKALTVKNRVVPPFLETNIFVSFRNGLSPHYALDEISEKLGFISKKEGGNSYICEGENIGFRKTWANSPKFWEQKLNKLNEILKLKIQYSDSTTLKELESEADEPDNENGE